MPLGYTHYFTYIFDGFTQDHWDAICKDATKVLKVIQEKKGIKLTGKLVRSKKILFNGFEADAHENFQLLKDSKAGSFVLTKTARKPYDLAVVSIALIASHHSQENVFEFSNDGGPSDFRDAAHFNAKVLGYAYKLPGSLSNRNETTDKIEKECEMIIKEQTDN